MSDIEQMSADLMESFAEHAAGRPVEQMQIRAHIYCAVAKIGGRLHRGWWLRFSELGDEHAESAPLIGPYGSPTEAAAMCVRLMEVGNPLAVLSCIPAGPPS